MIAAYPGTFDPLTIADLAIAEAVRDQLDVAQVDLVVSRRPLGRSAPERPCLDHRIDVLRQAAAARPGLGVVVTDAQLLADIAGPYDVLVIGADKWAQLFDPRYYAGSEAARDAALARLPRLAVVPRPGHAPPPHGDLLAIDPALAAVSATAARAGRRDWMAPEARVLDDASGAWSDPDRYAEWCAGWRSGATYPGPACP